MKTAMYLAGHGSMSCPRLIELQYQRIQRYRDALEHGTVCGYSAPVVFLDLRLPRFGMGQIDFQEVHGFSQLKERVSMGEFRAVYIDIDEIGPGPRPAFESGFVRDLLEKAGAKVWNVFSDDDGAFDQAVKKRCGPRANLDEVTDVSDFVSFFPSLVSGIVETALRRELGKSRAGVDPVGSIHRRIEVLKSQRPYAGGGRPFIEARLSAEWQERLQK